MFFEIGSHYVSQADLKFNDPLASVPSARMTVCATMRGCSTVA
jgi:hypothetical protein